MEAQKHIAKAISGLKDFQLATVNHIIKQFYEGGKSKILVADEVGLGKTIVAKGVIARMYEYYLRQNSGKPFNVFYICSNQTIARQNLNKLNIFEGEDVVDSSPDNDRLTSLAFQPRKINNSYKFEIRAFTPATSFEFKSNTGKADERVLLFRLLFRHPYLKGKTNRLKWFLKATTQMNDENWEKLITDAILVENKKKQKHFYHGEFRNLRRGIKTNFYQALDKKVPFNDYQEVYDQLEINHEKSAIYLLSKICSLKIRKNNYFHSRFSDLKRLIVYLRQLLAESCKVYLEAELFILDEFQRFSNLISVEQEDKPGIELARKVLNKEGTKILMLSATPFKPYTTDFDNLNNENHFKEFNQVLKFLFDGHKVDFKKYAHNRGKLFELIRHPEELKSNYSDAKKVKTELEKIYRNYIARTERLIASKNNDALINTNIHILDVHKEDIDDFIYFDRIVNYLNTKYKTQLTAPIEYVKSSPYPLSFLFDYQHKKKLEKYYKTDTELQRLVKINGNAWISLQKIRRYKPLKNKNKKVIPNAKIRLLIEETIKKRGWRYLWIPPSVPYYEMSGAYKNADDFSKTLIFSSWKMVPKMISTILSYEAERYSVGRYLNGNEEKAINYFERRRKPRPLLLFQTKGEALSGMNNFMLNYPSPFLSYLYDPENNLTKKKSLKVIKKELKEIVRQRLIDLGVFDMGSENGDWQKWTWFAVLLLDKYDKRIDDLKYWIKQKVEKREIEPDTDNEGQSKSEIKEEKKGKYEYFVQVYNVLCNDETPNISKLNDSQLDRLTSFIVNLILGSPALSVQRGLRKIFKNVTDEFEIIRNSYRIANGFISLFNKPESIATIQLTTTKGDYYSRVLQYCINGNIQSMLDEYFYLLKDSNSISSMDELTDTITSILTIRPSLVEVGNIEGLKKKIKNKIRTHYALDFGQQKLATAHANRQINIREAFNSPFRPFVLASTSIGQEGLDFHFYCKQIFHWNLPVNPVDFEQREGRIHRYKGHVIRLNIARLFLEKIKDYSDNLWDELFKVAGKENKVLSSTKKCDLIPFWHLDGDSLIKIERHVPLYPFSKDIEKYHTMQKVLANYRLTLGQPRQAELIELINKNDIGLYDDLMIILAPITFQND